MSKDLNDNLVNKWKDIGEVFQAEARSSTEPLRWAQHGMLEQWRESRCGWSMRLSGATVVGEE